MKATAALRAVFLLVVLASARAQTQNHPAKYDINRWRFQLFSPTTTVHVINGLQPGSDTLLVHCQSGDTDLGYFFPMVGEEQYWKFKMNILETTLYFCGFWWNHRQIHMDVYKKNMICDGPNLYFTVTEDGIIFRDDHGYVGLEHTWEPAAAGSTAGTPSL